MKSEKDKILSSLKKGVKQIAKIEAGKAKGQLASEMIQELIKERDGRGGSRAGAGKKSSLQTKYPNETKKLITLRVYPTQLKQSEGQYGRLQAAVDTLTK